MATWQFVADMSSASPTVNLDLNAPPLFVGDDWNLDPPKYNKAYAGGVLRHGQRPTTSVAGNRTLRIPVQVVATDRDAAATAIQNLGYQLARDNFLKVQFGSTPVFFRTFADPDYATGVKKTLTQEAQIVLSIEAEPFAYGPRVTAGTFTVSNDPAAGTNPMRFDVTGVQGDVPTPLLLLASSTGASGAPSGLVSKWTHISTRSRGTPGNYANVIQAENMLASTDTATSADATFSNGSKMRVTFATNTSLTVRLSDSFPDNGVATVDARGEYIVYARLAKTVSGDSINVQFRYGTGVVNNTANDVVAVPAGTSQIVMNLGKVSCPAWVDPVTLGYSGVELKTLLTWVALYAQRVSGSGSLDVDWLYFMPADESTVIVKFPNTDTTYAIDGTSPEGGSVYGLNTALDQNLNIAFPPQITGGGGFPEVKPNQTNRIHFIRHIDTASTDARTDTTTIVAYYWPRWREFTRP